MSEHYSDDGDRLLIGRIERYFDTALEMADFYFDKEEARWFKESLELDIVDSIESERGLVIPTCRYSGKDKKFHLLIEPNSMWESAHNLHNVSGIIEDDILRVTFGAGVGRAILGSKALPIKLNEDDPRQKELRNALYDSRPLQAFADFIDPCGDNNILQTVERMSEDEISKINALRFSTGASYQHMFGSLQQAEEMIHAMRQELIMSQLQRSVHLRDAFNILGVTQNAFDFYDSTVDHILFSLSNPMSPAEELRALLS